MLAPLTNCDPGDENDHRPASVNVCHPDGVCECGGSDECPHCNQEPTMTLWPWPGEGVIVNAHTGEAIRWADGSIGFSVMQQMVISAEWEMRT